MTVAEAALLLLAACAAGAINTIVGSGTLITFPALLALGFPPVTANVSNCIGLAFGGASGIWGYRRELAGLGALARTLVPLSVVGAATGAMLLLWLPERVFEAVVPVLIAAALVLIVIQPRVAQALRNRQRGPETRLSTRRRAVLQLGVAGTGAYGGYFGAAQGVLLVGLLGSLLPIGLQPVNALKNVLGTCANATAAVAFVLFARDQIAGDAVLLVMLGSIVGGLVGAGVGRRLPAPALRAVIVLVGTIALVRLVVS